MAFSIILGLRKIWVHHHTINARFLKGVFLGLSSEGAESLVDTNCSRPTEAPLTDLQAPSYTQRQCSARRATRDARRAMR